MSLHVETAGSGAPLVLIHGWGMHGGVWSMVRDALAQDFEIHVVDLPGMGYSAPCSPYDLSRLSREVAAVVPAQCAVCGWSLGGQVAIRMALDQPARVRQLILVGSTPCFVNRDDWQSGVLPEVFANFSGQVAADYYATLTRFLGLQAMGGDATRQMVRDLKADFMARPAPRQHVMQQALAILLETDLRRDIGALQCPVLLLHGARDMLAPVAAARWMADHIPQAQLSVIPGASHAPFVSHPRRFVSALQQFLEPVHAG